MTAISVELENPVLRGFKPDPSIVRVGDDYYIATSTFEWWPGVALHHSRDLVHWRLIGHALTRDTQLNLRGVADSGGVWAPSLSHADGRFWLIYTNVRTCGAGRPFKDVGIYLTTSECIEGPWAEPVTLNAIGFDPSLFHDDDGRKWIVNMMWDFRPGRNRFAGIVLQEYGPVEETLVGPLTKILAKDVLTEGPNLYKKDGWYYLMLAEGGTGWNHGISMARARAITGPYELDPQPSVLTTRDAPEWPLQKAGHGELVETPRGEWYLVHLASRPLGADTARRCTLGRETCLQRVSWSADGWLRLADGGTLPELKVPAPAGVVVQRWPATPVRDDFALPTMNASWHSLRGPMDDSWLSLTARPGWLSLKGRESLHSLFHQSLVAKPLASFSTTAETYVEFFPTHFTQAAGLICYYDTRTHFYLRVTWDEARGRVAGVAASDDGNYMEFSDALVSVEGWQGCHLRAVIERERLEFFLSKDAREWQRAGGIFDASKLSDDYGSALHFTGALVGLCAQDLGGAGSVAHFSHFEMR